MAENDGGDIPSIFRIGAMDVLTHCRATNHVETIESCLL